MLAVDDFDEPLDAVLGVADILDDEVRIRRPAAGSSRLIRSAIPAPRSRCLGSSALAALAKRIR
jgi:hypothetical protein